MHKSNDQFHSFLCMINIRTLSQTVAKKVGSVERKIIRRTFGSIHNNGVWRIRQNEALNRLYKENDWQLTHLLIDHSGLDI